jgi:hypothetical protein
MWILRSAFPLIVVLSFAHRADPTSAEKAASAFRSVDERQLDAIAFGGCKWSPGSSQSTDEGRSSCE